MHFLMLNNGFKLRLQNFYVDEFNFYQQSVFELYPMDPVGQGNHGSWRYEKPANIDTLSLISDFEHLHKPCSMVKLARF